MNAADIAVALGSGRSEGDSYKCPCSLNDARRLWRDPNRTARRRAERRPLSVAELATAKSFPIGFLQDHGAAELADGTGVAIRYFYEGGRQAERVRKRTALKAKDGSSWIGPKGVSPIPYGLWLLDDARAKRQLIIVESESDCLACWFHNYPALGMPDAKNVRGFLLERFREIDRLYVVKEPDAAGNEFPGRIAGHVRKLGYTGEICSITMPARVKDPCDLPVQPPADPPFSLVPKRPTTEGEGPR
jgi:putative DNA primase/helicase